MDPLHRLLIDALRADAVRHLQCDFKAVGSEFEFVEHYRSQHVNEGCNRSFAIAHTFWDSWIDQVHHGFGQYLYADITAGAWPLMAKEIAEHLEAGTPIDNVVVLRYFDTAPATALVPKQTKDS